MFGVRVRRAHEHRVGLVGQVDVVGVLARAGQEAIVFLAPEGLADVRQAWRSRMHPCRSPQAVAVALAGAAAMALPPIWTALTMFW